MTGNFVFHESAHDIRDSGSQASGTAVQLCPAQPRDRGLACGLWEQCPLDLCSAAALAPTGPLYVGPKFAFL